MQCMGLKKKPEWQQLQNNHDAKLYKLQMAHVREESACLHHCVVLLADLYWNVWPGNVLRAVVSKGHLQKAPQPTCAVYVFHCLRIPNVCVIPTYKSDSERNTSGLPQLVDHVCKGFTEQLRLRAHLPTLTTL